MESLASRDERTAGATSQPGVAVPAVQLIGVEKAYGLVQARPALRGVSLRIARGECYGLAGRNGAGKTTLIKVMLGLIAPDAGEARVFGVRPDRPEIRRHVGFVPEAAELPRGASPLQLVKRWARLRGLPVQAALAQGEANLRRLGMGELLHRQAHRFSKGEKQRTLVALALLGEPDLLVREVVLSKRAESERASSALVLESRLDAVLESSLGARRPSADGGSGHVYL